MNEHIKVAKSIIDEIYRYSENINSLDDECTTFPMVFMIIAGINNTIDNAEVKKNNKKELIQYLKEKYTTLWLKQAAEYEEEENLDLEKEEKEADREFSKILKRVTKHYKYKPSKNS